MSILNLPDNFLLRLAGTGGGILLLLYILQRIFNRRKRLLAELRRKKNINRDEVYRKFRNYLEKQDVNIFLYIKIYTCI